MSATAEDVWGNYALRVRGPWPATDPDTVRDFDPLLPARLQLEIDTPEEVLGIVLDVANARALRDALTAAIRKARP